MELHTIPTDDTMRSLSYYGTRDFPFAYYDDRLSEYPNHVIPWHWHDELEFSICRSGTVQCSVENQTCELNCGDGIFINTGMQHRFQSENGQMDVYVFLPDFIASPQSAVHREAFSPILSSNLECSVLRRGENREQDALLDLLKDFRTFLPSASCLEVQMYAAKLWHGFLACIDFSCLSPRTKKDAILRSRLHVMTQYITENYAKRITLEDIAASANISKSEALRCFKVGVRNTPVGYLNEYRLYMAQDRLLHSWDSETRIALDCGFNNLNYFCKVFKKVFDLSPATFRSLHANRDEARPGEADALTE